MIYVDELRDWGWRKGDSCHMFTDNHCSAEMNTMHSFALQIGLRRAWFQDRSGFPHYDLTSHKRFIAVKQGAKAVSCKEMVQITRMARLALIEDAKSAILANSTWGFFRYHAPLTTGEACPRCQQSHRIQPAVIFGTHACLTCGIYFTGASISEILLDAEFCHDRLRAIAAQEGNFDDQFTG